MTDTKERSGPPTCYFPDERPTPDWAVTKSLAVLDRLRGPYRAVTAHPYFGPTEGRWQGTAVTLVVGDRAEAFLLSAVNLTRLTPDKMAGDLDALAAKEFGT